MATEVKEFHFEVGNPPDEDDDDTVDARTQLKPSPPQGPAPPAVSIVKSLPPVTHHDKSVEAQEEMWANWLRWIGILLLLFGMFVAECVVLSHRDVGWVKVLSMSQDKNYDTLVATYGWYDVKLLVSDVLLRAPDWSDAVGLVGALMVMGCFYAIVAIGRSLYKNQRHSKLMQPCRPLMVTLGLAGIAVWVLYTVNVTTYINTRDFYWVLGGSSPIFLLGHVLALVVASLV